MGTPQGLHKDSMGTLWGLHGLHEDSMRSPRGLVESMRSPWERVGDCKIQAESVESEHLARTPHGLAGYQFGTGPCIIGAFSPRGVHTESE